MNNQPATDQATPAEIGQHLLTALDRFTAEGGQDMPAPHRDFAAWARQAAEILRAIPGTVHLVGIPGDGYEQTEQKVHAAFADADEAEQWAYHYNATVPWDTETKTVVLTTVPFVPAGARAPEPGADA